MRFSAVIFSAASLASAYTILKRQTDAPACAQTCYTSTSPAPCTNTDTACQCLNPNFIEGLTSCVVGACTSPDDLQAAQASAVSTCKQAGVDLTNPVPACATACGQDISSTGCGNTTTNAGTSIPDGACLCKNTNYVQSVESCIKSSCTGQDLTTAQTVGAAACRAYGVDISSSVSAA